MCLLWLELEQVIKITETTVWPFQKRIYQNRGLRKHQKEYLGISVCILNPSVFRKTENQKLSGIFVTYVSETLQAGDE